ncbi:unnamed protein product [Pedinophyceae sp. YPF-701]|nr:unnamed protein product [Pedinophyceae sp. YPF-701]
MQSDANFAGISPRRTASTSPPRRAPTPAASTRWRPGTREPEVARRLHSLAFDSDVSGGSPAPGSRRPADDDLDLFDGDLDGLDGDLRGGLELDEEIKETEDSLRRREARKQWEEKRRGTLPAHLLEDVGRSAHHFFGKCVQLDASMKLADPLQWRHYGALFGKLADLLLRQFVRGSEDADPRLVDFWTRAPLLLPEANGPGGISALQLATPDRLTTASHKAAIEQGDLAFTAHSVNVMLGSNPALYARDASSFKEMALRAQDEDLAKGLKILPNPYAVLLKKRPETRGLLLHYISNRLRSGFHADRRKLASAGTQRAKESVGKNVKPVAPRAAAVGAWVDALVAGNDTWVDDTIRNAPMIVGRFGGLGVRRAGGLYQLVFDARNCRKLHSEPDNLTKCTWGYNALKLTADEAEATRRIPELLRSLAKHVMSGDVLDPRLAERMGPAAAVAGGAPTAPYLRAAGDRARTRDALCLTDDGESLLGSMWDEAAVAAACVAPRVKEEYRDMVAACEEELEAYDACEYSDGTRRAVRLSQSLGPGWCGCPDDERCIKRHGDAHLMPNGQRAPGHPHCLTLAEEPAAETAFKDAIKAELICRKCKTARKYVRRTKLGAAAGGASSGDGDGDGCGDGDGDGCGDGDGDGCGGGGAPVIDLTRDDDDDDDGAEHACDEVTLDGEKLRLAGGDGYCPQCYYHVKTHGYETPTRPEDACPHHATCWKTRGHHVQCPIGPGLTPIRTEEVQEELRATTVCANPACPYHEYAKAWPLAHMGFATCARGAERISKCSDEKYRCLPCKEWHDRYTEQKEAKEEERRQGKPGPFWDPSPERPLKWQVVGLPQPRQLLRALPEIWGSKRARHGAQTAVCCQGLSTARWRGRA